MFSFCSLISLSSSPEIGVMIGWLTSSLFLYGEETRSEILRIRIGEMSLEIDH